MEVTIVGVNHQNLVFLNRASGHIWEVTKTLVNSIWPSSLAKCLKVHPEVLFIRRKSRHTHCPSIFSPSHTMGIPALDGILTESRAGIYCFCIVYVAPHTEIMLHLYTRNICQRLHMIYCKQAVPGQLPTVSKTKNISLVGLGLYIFSVNLVRFKIVGNKNLYITPWKAHLDLCLIL